ncbi:hypothetical protein [Acuticoccus sediminis]|nr:hypothetical protein [Acuticoccus sediminis]
MDRALLEHVIRERLKDAARTERRLPAGSLGPSAMRAVWPEMDPPTKEEVDAYGYTDEEKAEAKREAWEALIRRRPATPADVSRMMETIGWVARYVHDAMHRRAVFAWARGQVKKEVGGESFRSWCRRHSIHANQGTRFVSYAVNDIATHAPNFPELLVQAEELAVCTERPDFDTHFDTLRTSDDGAPPRHQHWHMEPGAKPVAHDDSDPEAVAAMINRLDKARERARKAQARRRAKLGLVDG